MVEVVLWQDLLLSETPRIVVVKPVDLDRLAAGEIAVPQPIAALVGVQERMPRSGVLA